MNYTILIYESAEGFALRNDPEKQQEYWAAWPAYRQALEQAGVFVNGAGLQPPEAGTVVRLRGGQRLVQDGPYADTKEQLGGFFIIDVPDLDTALQWAARCPSFSFGGSAVEVRPTLCQSAPATAARDVSSLARTGT